MEKKPPPPQISSADLTAAELLTSQLLSPETALSSSDIDVILQQQREILARMDRSNEMLFNCSSLAFSRIDGAKRELNWYSQLLTDAKKDLDSIFRRLRAYRQTFTQLYPSAFAQLEAGTSKTEENSHLDSDS